MVGRELIVAVLVQIAQMERDAILIRTSAGRTRAKAALEATGCTHRGRASLDWPPKQNAADVRAWREAGGASLSQTAEKFGVSVTTVKRYLVLSSAAESRVHGRRDGRGDR